MTNGLDQLFNLRRDQQDADTIDSTLRANAQAAGTNLWVLFFAILIASVGLNVNSTAVIIGAMLISPLMGPIVGIGYAAAVFDFALIRAASKNLALFIALSLVTSIVYFALSPLDQPQSELLARTSPTLWDVLIAAFGGAAGMVAVTRRSFSNIVPGVAIATALMPPLCTAGFSLAHGRWTMFAGAAFLFTINGVFIAAATLAVAKLLRLPARGAVDEATRTRHRAIIAVGLTAVLVPAAWLGYRFVQNEVFDNAASNVGRELLSDTRVLAFEVDAPGRTLHLTTVGDRDLQQLQQRARNLLKVQGETAVRVDVRRAGDDPLNVGALRKDLNEDLKRSLLAQVQATDQKVTALERKMGIALAQTQAAQALQFAPERRLAGLVDEIHAQLPAVRTAYLAQALLAPVAASGASAASAASASAPDAAGSTAIVVVDVERPLRRADRQRLERWLAVRLQRREVSVVDHIVRFVRR
jgi:uncharacterized hydrophobic protein (TIGR00271 family)